MRRFSCQRLFDNCPGRQILSGQILLFADDFGRWLSDKRSARNSVPALGSVSNEMAEQKARDEYDSFDSRRKQYEALKADQDDIKELEAFVK